jgi:hypothetical protein
LRECASREAERQRDGEGTNNQVFHLSV